MDGDRKVTDDADKAEVLNRAFAEKFTNHRVTELPAAPDYPLDLLQTFTVTAGAVRAILDSISPHPQGVRTGRCQRQGDTGV